MTHDTEVTFEPSTSEPTVGYSVGEVAERTSLTGHTLRFYEKEGLFPAPVSRNSAGRRVFSEQEVEWLLVCSRLRSSGMPLDVIRQYVELFKAGPHTVGERLELLQTHERRVRKQLADLQETLATIEHKVEVYSAHLAAGTANELWTNGPECDD